ncbi:MAG: hypothetical protein JNL21_21200 [Myxococcales bacterium]|nr:hypothetical protein [Myxococcales bacterium]
MKRTRATKGKTDQPENRRGSPEAVRKRRAARLFNDLLAEGARPLRDGRTEKKRRRILRELKDGAAQATGEPLKPIDVLLRVQTLLDLGEPVAAIRKACKPPKPVPSSDAVVDGVRRIHEAYGFALDTYQFVGIDGPTLRKARITSEGASAGGPRRAIRRPPAAGSGRAA